MIDLFFFFEKLLQIHNVYHTDGWLKFSVYLVSLLLSFLNENFFFFFLIVTIITVNIIDYYVTKQGKQTGKGGYMYHFVCIYEIIYE